MSPPLPRHVGFIRNVMIGRSGLTASHLLRLAETSGAVRPTSHLATGNLAFDAAPADVANIADRLEEAIAGTIGRHEPIFVRSVDHLERAVTAHRFAELDVDDVKDRCVSYLPVPLPETATLPLTTPRGDVVIFEVDGLDAYSVTRLVDSRSSSPGPTLEKLTGAPVTSRNWNTIERILATQVSA